MKEEMREIEERNEAFAFLTKHHNHVGRNGEKYAEYLEENTLDAMMDYSATLRSRVKELEERNIALREMVEVGDIQVPKNDWISASDRLPELEQPCLSYSDLDGVMVTKYKTYHPKSIGYSDGKRDRWFEYLTHNGVFKQHNVTHWQPLPEPPTK